MNRDIVPNRRPAVGVLTAVGNRQDVAFLVTGVVRRTARSDGHIVIVCRSFVAQQTRNSCHGCLGSIKNSVFALVDKLTDHIEHSADIELACVFAFALIGNGDTVPSRPTGVGMSSFNGEDVSFFRTAVIRAATLGNQHIVVIGFAFIGVCAGYRYLVNLGSVQDGVLALIQEISGDIKDRKTSVFFVQRDFSFINGRTAAGQAVGVQNGIGVNVNITVVCDSPICKFAVLGFQSSVFSDIGGKNPSDCRCNPAVRAERKRTVIHVNGAAVGRILQQFVGIITKRTFRNCIDGIADKNQFFTAFDCDFIGMGDIFESHTNIDRIGIRIIGLGTNDQTFDRLRSISVFVVLIRKLIVQSRRVEHNAGVQNDIESFFFQIVCSCDGERRSHLP